MSLRLPGRAACALAVIGTLAFAACGGGSGASGGAAGAAADTSGGVAEPTGPLGTGDADDDQVAFVTSPPTTASTTTTTVAPTTTTSTSTSTTTSTSTSTSTSTTTSTTTTVPPPTTVRCSFSADALFEPGAAVLTPDAVTELGALAAAVGADVQEVVVEGHTDHRGSDDDNQALSEERAAAAAVALADAGLDEDLITVVGRGESDAHQPDGSAAPSDAEMAADRRVDIVIDADVPITADC